MTQLIVALDVDDRSHLDTAVGTLADAGVSWFKIGLQAFMACGVEGVGAALRRGKVFLDLKFHDIPNTVAGAVTEAARLGVHMMNVHAGGGAAMMKSAQEALARHCLKENVDRPILLAVTVLTSMDTPALESVGVHVTPERQVETLARLACANGMDGVVCSAQEIAPLRRALGQDFRLITPGIRPSGAAAGDQARVATPEAAARNGADWIVVGRPILRADDPAAAAEAVLAALGGHR